MRSIALELNLYFKSIVEQDRCPVVVCDLKHEIIYMNPAAAVKYRKYGGASLVGKSLLDCHNENSAVLIKKVVAWFAKNKENNIVYTYRNDKENRDVYMVALRDDGGELIGYYEKHEYRNREALKLYDID
jgi:PAS domain-containing protein